MMLRWFIVLLGLLSAVPALAVNPDERLADPALEARARTLSAQLRCLVCQSESIDDSNATLAHDLRVLVRERLTAGDSDEQVLSYLRARYGDYVLLNPPVERATWLLWFGPGIVLVLASAGVGLAAMRRRPVLAAPLDPEEQARLKALLQRDES
ncbi:MAG: cytochrome c-type biogenesis protein [Aliidongia sp.]